MQVYNYLLYGIVSYTHKKSLNIHVQVTMLSERLPICDSHNCGSGQLTTRFTTYCGSGQLTTSFTPTHIIIPESVRITTDIHYSGSKNFPRKCVQVDLWLYPEFRTHQF